jgi:hypothetical protein
MQSFALSMLNPLATCQGFGVSADKKAHAMVAVIIDDHPAGPV